MDVDDILAQPVDWRCHLCVKDMHGNAHDAMAHLAQVHGQTVQAWPDGGPVVDASNVPELLLPDQ